MTFPSYATEQKNGTDHYIDTFATYTPNEPTTNTYSASNGSKGLPLQRMNMALRVATFLLALAATLATLFAKSTDGFGWSLDYKSSAAYGFFLGTNAVVALYGFLASAVAIFMWMNGSSLSTPVKLLLTVLVADVIGVVILLLAFASATATEVIGRNGFYVSVDDRASAQLSLGVCQNYSSFCDVFEAGLGFSGAAILSFISCTAIDGYYLHLRGI